MPLNPLPPPPLFFFKSGTSETRGWAGHGEQDQCLWIHGVLCKDEGRCERGVRDGDQGCTTGQTREEEQQMCPTVNGGVRTASYRGKEGAA